MKLNASKTKTMTMHTESPLLIPDGTVPIGNVVASHAEGCTVARPKLDRFILCKRRSGGSAHEDEGWSIETTVSDAIVGSWLWSTATRSSHWPTSVDYCK